MERKTGQVRSLVLALLFVGALLLVTAWSSGTQREPRRWEYKVVLSNVGPPAQNEETLNKPGAEGWELVGSEPIKDSSGAYFYFKRPK